MAVEQSPRVNLLPIVIALILVLTAIPYELRWPSWRLIEFRAEMRDVIINVVFFLPLGWFSRRNLAVTLGFAALVSTCAEVAQLFSETRHPQLPDIATNVIGALVGWLLARILLGPLETVPRTMPLTRNLCVFLFAIGILLFPTMIPRMVPSNISNWDSSFELKVGREDGAPQNWKGNVQAVSVTAGAMTSSRIAELAASGPGSLPRTLAGSNPELFQRIQQAGQFTVLVWGITDDVEQIGPARIVTWSRNLSASNLTIAQDSRRIVFRVRTVSTNEIGGRPETQTHSVLEAGKSFFIAGTYDGEVARVFVDGVQAAENNLAIHYSLTYMPSLASALMCGYLLALGFSWFLSAFLNDSRQMLILISVGGVALMLASRGFPFPATSGFLILFTAGILIAGASLSGAHASQEHQNDSGRGHN